MCLQFGFLICWQKDFGAKAAHKRLMKLTPGDVIFAQLACSLNDIIFGLNQKQQTYLSTNIDQDRGGGGRQQIGLTLHSNR
jgi:hypothetical protein